MYQSWLSNVKPMGLSVPMIKYRDLDPAERAALRTDWNRPVTWPIVAIAIIVVLVIIPGVRTFFRERQ